MYGSFIVFFFFFHSNVTEMRKEFNIYLKRCWKFSFCQGHVWKADVSITAPEFGENVVGITSFTFESGSAVLELSGFTIENPRGNTNYTFDLLVYTEPELHSVSVTSTPVQVKK